MKFYLVSSALVLFITAPGISAADKQRRLRGESPVTDYSNYRDAIANAEDDDEGRAYGYNNYNPGREVANESGYGHMGYGHMGYGDDGDGGFPEAENFAAVAQQGWTCDTRVCCGDATWAKCGLAPNGASCNVVCNGYNNDGGGGAPLGSDPSTWGPSPGSQYGPNSYQNNEGYKHRANNFGSDSATFPPPSYSNNGRSIDASQQTYEDYKRYQRQHKSNNVQQVSQKTYDEYEKYQRQHQAKSVQVSPKEYDDYENYKRQHNAANSNGGGNGNGFCRKFEFDHHQCNNYPEQCSFDGRRGCVPAY